MSDARLPRDTTRQAEAIRYGEAARFLHCVTGAVIVLFVLVHVVVQSIVHVPFFGPVASAAPWLKPLQQQNWIHAVLYFSIAFHTLYGLKLLLGEIGVRTEYKSAFWAIVAVSTLFGLREVARYAGI